jgi:hypothetical protein
MGRGVRLGCLTADGIRVPVDGWVVGMGRSGFLFEPFSAASVARVHTAFLRLGFDVHASCQYGDFAWTARIHSLAPRPGNGCGSGCIVTRGDGPTCTGLMTPRGASRTTGCWPSNGIGSRPYPTKSWSSRPAGRPGEPGAGRFPTRHLPKA